MTVTELIKAYTWDRKASVLDAFAGSAAIGVGCLCGTQWYLTAALGIIVFCNAEVLTEGKTSYI